MASRYGWSFADIQELELTHLLSLLEVIKDKLDEETKEKLQVQSFSSWQIIETLAGMFGKGKGRTFQNHLDSLGLWKREIPKIDNVAEFKKKAITKAERILSMYFKGGTNSGE